MATLVGLFVLINCILLRQFHFASIVLLFVCMKICFDFLSSRSKRLRGESELNMAIRLANKEKRRRAAQKAADIHLSEILKRTII